MGLTRKTQIAIRAEAIEGVAATLTSADLVPVLADPAPSFTPANEILRRNLATGSLSPSQGRNTFRSGTISFTMELAGPADGVPTTVPEFALPLEACGLGRRAVQLLGGGTMGTANGMIPIASTYAEAVTTATGQCWHRHFDGDTYLFVDPDHGQANPSGGNNLTFTAGAVTTAYNTPTSYDFAHGFRPNSTKTSGITVTSGTVDADVNDILYQAATGARARVTEALATADIGAGATLRYELFPQSGNFNSGTAITNLTDTGTYTPSGTENQLDFKSVTIEGRFDGVVVKLKGARGNVTLRAEAGGQVFLDFEFQGQGVLPSDGALYNTPTAPALPAIMVSTNLDLQIDPTGNAGTSLIPKWSTFTFDVGNQVELPTDPSDASGYGPAQITGREPTATLDPEAVREAIYPFLGQDWDKSDYRVVLQTGTFTPGSGTGNAFRIEIPFCQTASFGTTSRQGVNTYDLNMSPTVAEVANADAAAPADNLLYQHGALTDEEFRLFSY